MFVLRMLLMLVVTSGRYGTSPVKLRNILSEDSLRLRDDESAMWNDPYFDRIFGLGNLVEQHGAPEIKETRADDESLEDKSEEKNAEQDESENEEISIAAKSEEPRKDEEELRFGKSWKHLRRYNRPGLLDDFFYPKKRAGQDHLAVRYDPARSARELPDCDETTTESFNPKEYSDYDASGEGSDDKTSGGNVREFVYFTGIVAGSCFVFLVA